MDLDDIVHAHYRTAQLTAVNNQRQQLNRQTHAQGDAEDRAFHAERELLRMKQAHENEQQEHHLTRLALKKMLAQHIGWQRAIEHLAKQWAPQAATTVEAFTETVRKEAEAAGAKIQHPGNEAQFARDIERLRDAQRLLPKQPG